MSILAALTKAYDRLAEDHKVPPFGYSSEKIGFLISLNEDGTPAGLPIDLRQGTGKKLTARMLSVPASFKRPGITPRPFFLWDNTAYCLGITASPDKDALSRFSSFKDFHAKVLSQSDDPGLLALLGFLRDWTPDRFAALGWPEEMKDQNVIFTLESDRLSNRYLHDRAAAREVWADLASAETQTQAVCLVTGKTAPIARLHPAIKGVWGGQSSGVSIVSYNKDAFESYGHQQGDNAPVSEAAAFAYTAVLNRFLESDSPNRLQIGDASTVFWADASDAATAQLAEDAFLAMFDSIDEDKQAGEVRAILDKIRQGLPVHDFAPQLCEGVRFYVLGLAPNAARVSIRFWFEGDFGRLAENYRRYVEDIRIAPPPRDPHPPLWRYLQETAVLGKRENVPPNLAGDVLRAILTGSLYPLTLLSNILMRLRSDKTVSVLRVALLRAVLIRNYGYTDKEAPVAFDPDNTNKGYLLGRLFAVYEQVQSAALGRNVNATIKDKFYGAASAQPRKVFAILESGSANHLSKVGKARPGARVNLEKEIGAIMGLMSPGDDPFPASLSAEQQALFGLGYYHQRNQFFVAKDHDSSAQKETAV
ncbi:type I-C CRISPR-associated protein Cas8c/Csd1 [Magnetospirillum molischianum]|uniref:CRISPR-associated protein, Csd1 family n=1 Tax=Magnetospirillum molischianum DSM 120 TaxID=1150626 RepID=H8FND8_MAGML|nr:type I-C CRISPR-associated protein Cas8c/Csd1 [Magnetospirillum molischianum]CCG39876.1 CRISPR-associated protein, Csd1 family [Magnetospirillum molischianum DSM 120]